MTAPVLAVVVPTRDEAAHLPPLLDDLGALSVPHVVVVADGGSRDGTSRIARDRGHLVIEAPAGRARQMNAGARAVESDWLLFLHADSRLPARSAAAVADWLSSADPSDIGIFRFRLEGRGWFWRFIEVGQRVRQRLYGLAYGDQGLLVSRGRFEAIGGFPDQPLMEDVEILRRLKRGGRVRPIPAPLPTSPRRYERDGRWFGWLRNLASITLYLAGVPASRLAGWYAGPISGPRASPRGDRLVVFAKAPRPGAVKTRLARDLGDEGAAALYRRMGRAVVDSVRAGPWSVTVCYDPPDAGHEIASWLDADADPPLALVPQVSGSLGDRMDAATRDALAGAARVCVIGTDAPDVDSVVVRQAFAALDRVDCVIGPATDGGYYLIGLAGPAPSLFQGVPWSTEGVLAATIARARKAGLTVHQLAPLTDVDEVADLARVSEGFALSDPP